MHCFDLSHFTFVTLHFPCYFSTFDMWGRIDRSISFDHIQCSSFDTFASKIVLSRYRSSLSPELFSFSRVLAHASCTSDLFSQHFALLLNFMLSDGLSRHTLSHDLLRQITIRLLLLRHLPSFAFPCSLIHNSRIKSKHPPPTNITFSFLQHFVP